MHADKYHKRIIYGSDTHDFGKFFQLWSVQQEQGKKIC